MTQADQVRPDAVAHTEEAIDVGWLEAVCLGPEWDFMLRQHVSLSVVGDLFLCLRVCVCVSKATLSNKFWLSNGICVSEKLSDYQRKQSCLQPDEAAGRRLPPALEGIGEPLRSEKRLMRQLDVKDFPL